jgi:asparagine synthetase B (glutamine-hydrolysing)
MCGIVGVFLSKERQQVNVARSWLSKKLRHRESDWSESIAAKSLLPAHERLTIVDPQRWTTIVQSLTAKLFLLNGEILQPSENKRTIQGLSYL